MCNKCGHGCKPHIPESVLEKLPVGGHFVKFEKTKEIVNISETETKENWVIALMWEWHEIKPVPTTKRALFNKDTGNYIGEIHV